VDTIGGRVSPAPLSFDIVQPSEGYTARTPTRVDTKELERLFIAVDDAEGLEPIYLEQDLQDAWRRPDFVIERDSVLVEGADGAVAAYGHVETRAAEDLVQLGWVHPHHWRKGLGTYLVRELERRARGRTADDEIAFKQLVNIGSATDPAIGEILKREGYSLVRHFWQMALELDGWTLPSLPDLENVSFRVMSAPETSAVYSVLAEAFIDHFGPWPNQEEWVAEMLGSETHDPTMWFVAESGGRLVGALTAELRGERGHVIDLGVRKDWRKRGVARTLLLASFADFKRRGIHRVTLGVDSESLTGATRLYESLGMKRGRGFDFYAKPLVSS
jgi:mycothiol synthase